MRILVTGATGLVGRALIPVLANEGHAIVAMSGRSGHTQTTEPAASVVWRSVDLRLQTEMDSLTAGIDAVVHLAAIADRHAASEADIQCVNTLATERLARAAARTGASRFVFLSSIYVNGEASGETPFSEAETPRPYGVYGRSKHDAERRLSEIESETGLTMTIIRTPMIVGVPPRGSLAALCGLIDRGVPLPFMAVANRRNMVGIDNLIDFLRICLGSDRARGTFLICDQPAISTPDLIRRLCALRGRKERLFPVPQSLFNLAGLAPPVRARLGALWLSQELNIGKAQSALAWRQPRSLDQTLEAAVLARPGGRLA